MTRACVFLYLLLGSTVILAQDDCDLVITGHVIDEHDRSPLSYAEVYISELQRGAVADPDGYYRLEGLCAGTYSLRIMHLGCESVIQKVTLNASKELDFFLEHHAEELQEMEITRERTDENVGMTHQNIDREELQRASGRSIGEVLANVPGVTLLNTGPTIAKPMIHGLSGNRILTLNQGIRQEDQQWGTEHAPNLDPLSSDRITVVKGAATVQYGADALGGVIITEPVKLPDAPGTSGELNMIGKWNGRGGAGNAMLQGGSKKLRGVGWRIQGSARQLGDQETPSNVLSNTGLREAGASAALGIDRHRFDATAYYSYFARETGILRAAHIGNLTDLNNAIQNGELSYERPFTYNILAPRQSVQHHLARGEATYRTNDLDQLVLTYAYQADDRKEFDIRRISDDDRPSIDLFLYTHQGDLTYKHFLGLRVHGKVGVNSTYQENFNVPGTGVRPLIPDFTKSTFGGFLLEHYQLSERVEVEAGFRLDQATINVVRFDANDVLQTPQHEFSNQALSVGANWNVRDSLAIRSNVSTGFRPPHVSELYSEGLHHGSAAIEEGDAELGSERILKASVDMEGWWMKGKLNASFTTHIAQINDYIFLRPDGYRLTIRGAFPVFEYTVTDALIYGTDLSLSYRLRPDLEIRTVFSLVRGRDGINNEWLFRMPSDRWTNNLTYTPTGSGNWSGLRVGLISSTVFEQTRFPAEGDFIDPPGAYHLLGLSCSIERKAGNGSIIIGIEGSNLLNTRYREYLDTFRYYADAAGADVLLRIGYQFKPRTNTKHHHHAH